MNKYPLIRKIYLYSFSLVGLILITIGTVRLITLGLKAYIFTKADDFYEYPIARPVIAPDGTKKEDIAQPSKEELEKYQKNQQTSNRQREAAESLAMIIVGLPLYAYHWRKINKDKEENNA